ncbi:metallophosphoesterase [Thermococcus sibiricus]|uniref:Putative metallophosphoesterase, calcineurin superfamily n=1 Tax=Thermococcus sibiricus TaxID=172049 RepID=A0A101ELW7_9EURY|nr:metallophosphoesterase [Thermococcus sibiricus]KUK17793.1 MAG: putative metallophosphoesterase, calcineurin superfamily [Thermococcus sibiricus]
MKLNLPSFLWRKGLPEVLLETSEPKIMHISDTPDNIYSFILNLIEKSRPEYIIHTGDLVDNIKLERRPELKERYKKRAKELLDILENSNATVYIVPGNEDDPKILKKFSRRAKIIKPGDIIEIEGIRLALAHEPYELKNNKHIDFALYGHNFKVIEKGLNGVLNINFILPYSKRVITIKYPDGTNFERGYKVMRGL